MQWSAKSSFKKYAIVSPNLALNVGMSHPGRKGMEPAEAEAQQNQK